MSSASTAFLERNAFSWYDVQMSGNRMFAVSKWLAGLWSSAKAPILALARSGRLANGEDAAVRVLLAPREVYAQLNTHAKILSAHDETCALQHRREVDAARYRASRVLLRLALSSQAANVAPSEWAFSETAHGKPVVAGKADRFRAHFNISHTDAGLALAFSKRAVGVDVEDLSRAVDPGLYTTMLTRAEYRRLMFRTPASRARHFLKIWAMKEAYAKLLGLGHSLDFARIEFAPRSGRLRADGNFDAVTSSALASLIRVHTIPWRAGRHEHCVAVAYEGERGVRIHLDVLTPHGPG